MAIPGTAPDPKIVTLSGDPASGKSTIAKKLSAAWAVPRHSGGDIHRARASRAGMSLADVGHDKSLTDDIDVEVDRYIRNLGQTGESMIVDSRLGWLFIPQSFKVRMLTRPAVAASRRLADPSLAETYNSLAQAEGALAARHDLERARFLEKYDTDIDNAANFDLIIDNSFSDADAAAKIVAEGTGAHFSGQPFPKIWLSPKQLIPLESSAKRDGGEKLLDYAESMATKGFDRACPITALQVGSSFYIYDGHHRTFGALAADLPLMPVSVIRADEILPREGMRVDDFVAESFRLGGVYDWQDGVDHVRKLRGHAPVDWIVSQGEPRQPAPAALRPMIASLA